ncbi:hypothetical protein GQ44DRAFT_751632 [Phaeosphaeriaceae sp. PMI808]|nr:hypothetical protein GQ44DRAFT_751632 [Phaeosphaeriaceae sp. PMI808]
MLRVLLKPAAKHFFTTVQCQSSHRIGHRLRLRPLHSKPALYRALSGPAQSSGDSVNPSSAEKGRERDKEGARNARQRSRWEDIAFKMIEGAATAGGSIFLLAVVGYSYTSYYNRMVLANIENAFSTGEPVLELATGGSASAEVHDDRWIPRLEQEKIDQVVSGMDMGRYHLIMGERGTGKSSMIIDAIGKIDGEGVAMMEAHADPEIFRIRLGRCLNFEFHEDNIGSLFSIRGPRDASAILDIERAFNKLEKVALIRRVKVGRPLVLIINQAHLIQDDKEGRDLIELIQQRAEQWAAAGLAVVVINTDKYWVYEKLKQAATRMEVTHVTDLPKDRAMMALRNYQFLPEHTYDMIGGRLTPLSRVAKSNDMYKMCDHICGMEKIWFLNECGILGSEMDDDVMDQQKYASSAMVLAHALHKQSLEMESIYDPSSGHLLPGFPLHRARYIMTRADFIRQHHKLSIFAIDAYGTVRASSVPMQRAFSEIFSEPGFDNFLSATLERINEIESLQRTKEITLKDLWEGGRYRISTRGWQGNTEREQVIEIVERNRDDEKNQS